MEKGKKKERWRGRERERKEGKEGGREEGGEEGGMYSAEEKPRGAGVTLCGGDWHRFCHRSPRTESQPHH